MSARQHKLYTNKYNDDHETSSITSHTQKIIMGCLLAIGSHSCFLQIATVSSRQIVPYPTVRSSVAMTPPAYNELEETHFYDKHVTIGPREKVFVCHSISSSEKGRAMV